MNQWSTIVKTFCLSLLFAGMVAASASKSFAKGNANSKNNTRYTMTYDELMSLNLQQRADYLARLRALVVLFDSVQQSAYGKDTFAYHHWLEMLLARAQARESVEGAKCLYAGILTKLKRGSKRLYCPRPKSKVCNGAIECSPALFGHKLCVKSAKAATADCLEKADKTPGYSAFELADNLSEEQWKYIEDVEEYCKDPLPKQKKAVCDAIISVRIRALRKARDAIQQADQEAGHQCGECEGGSSANSAAGSIEDLAQKLEVTLVEQSEGFPEHYKFTPSVQTSGPDKGRYYFSHSSNRNYFRLEDHAQTNRPVMTGVGVHTFKVSGGEALEGMEKYYSAVDKWVRNQGQNKLNLTETGTGPTDSKGWKGHQRTYKWTHKYLKKSDMYTTVIVPKPVEDGQLTVIVIEGYKQSKKDWDKHLKREVVKQIHWQENPSTFKIPSPKKRGPTKLGKMLKRMFGPEEKEKLSPAEFKKAKENWEANDEAFSRDHETKNNAVFDCLNQGHSIAYCQCEYFEKRDDCGSPK